MKYKDCSAEVLRDLLDEKANEYFRLESSDEGKVKLRAQIADMCYHYIDKCRHYKDLRDNELMDENDFSLEVMIAFSSCLEKYAPESGSFSGYFYISFCSEIKKTLLEQYEAKRSGGMTNNPDPLASFEDKNNALTNKRIKFIKNALSVMESNNVPRNEYPERLKGLGISQKEWLLFDQMHDTESLDKPISQSDDSITLGDMVEDRWRETTEKEYEIKLEVDEYLQLIKKYISKCRKDTVDRNVAVVTWYSLKILRPRLVVSFLERAKGNSFINQKILHDYETMWATYYSDQKQFGLAMKSVLGNEMPEKTVSEYIKKFREYVACSTNGSK